MVNRAGVPTDVPIYRVNATVPEGAMNEERKAGLVKDVTDLLLEADGGEPDPLRVWVLIGEVPNGNWGAAGQVIDFAQLRAAAKAAREEAASGDA
jgi:phenylpyruvate tautomerase PptA (4-oxalocrotonate tautomerase family)